MKNPFSALLQSRKFWLMVLDVVVSVAVYFVGKYVNPELSKDILWVIGLLQPVFVVIIGAIAHEDASLNAANAARYEAELDASYYANVRAEVKKDAEE